MSQLKVCSELTVSDKNIKLTNLMKESVTLETFCNICYILVMQLNDFPDKNLKSSKTQWVTDAIKQLKDNSNKHISRYQPVPVNQLCPSSLAVKNG